MNKKDNGITHAIFKKLGKKTNKPNRKPRAEEWLKNSIDSFNSRLDHAEEPMT